MSDFILYIYRSSLVVISTFIILMMLLWGNLGYFFTVCRKRIRIWKIINIILVLGMIGVTLYITVLDRRSTKKEVVLIPFYSFYEASEQPEMYRSMLMNIFLFEPIGLALPFVLPSQFEKKVTITIVFGVLLSLCVEMLQYIFCLGRVEVDDVICNTIGSVIGTGAFLIYKKRIVSKKTIREPI